MCLPFVLFVHLSSRRVLGAVCLWDPAMRTDRYQGPRNGGAEDAAASSLFRAERKKSEKTIKKKRLKIILRGQKFRKQSGGNSRFLFT